MLENLIQKYNIFGNSNFNLTDILFIFIFIILIIEIFNLISRNKIKKKIDTIPGFKINEEIQEKLNQHTNLFEKLFQKYKENDFSINEIQSKLKNQFTYQIIKYNPYQDMGVGGKQSFSVSLINKKGNGFIVTSLYSREKNRVLIKEIQNFKALEELSDEEKTLLN